MFIKICPYCKERIKSGAVRCKHCHANLEGNGNASARQDDDGIRYLQNGFAKIDSECAAIEENMKLRTGLVFVKHQYSGDELINAVNQIESFVEKMRADLYGWESVNKLSQQVKSLFEEKAEEVYHRLESLCVLIEQREPTWWEKAKVIARRILEKLFSLFSIAITEKVREKLSSAA
jgi:hypothetical protein